MPGFTSGDELVQDQTDLLETAVQLVPLNVSLSGFPLSIDVQLTLLAVAPCSGRPAPRG
jgi:hypothetical protein